MAQLSNIADWLNTSLGIKSIPDYAINGVQVENSGEITGMITAVDISYKAVQAAISKKANLILVHHGLYWKKPAAVTGRIYRIVKELIANDIALCAVHLPLDIHPLYGNNISLAKELELEYLENFGNYNGIKLLVAAKPFGFLNFSSFCERFQRKIGKPLYTMGDGTAEIKKIGICSGGGLSEIEEAFEAGCDTYITGDAGHTAVTLAKELPINLLCGGHYNTETLGIRNLGEQLSIEFGVPVQFVDIPTQL